jgi:hypothetical protein
MISIGVLWLQRTQHQQGDDGDDRHEDRVVEEDRVMPEGGDPRLEVDAARRRLSRQILGEGAEAPERRHRARGDTGRQRPHPLKPRLHVPSVLAGRLRPGIDDPAD